MGPSRGRSSACCSLSGCSQSPGSLNLPGVLCLPGTEPPWSRGTRVVGFGVRVDGTPIPHAFSEGTGLGGKRCLARTNRRLGWVRSNASAQSQRGPGELPVANSFGVRAASGGDRPGRPWPSYLDLRNLTLLLVLFRTRESKNRMWVVCFPQ